MVFKGHGKSEHEGSSMVAKTPAGKFISKSKSGGNSQYATSTNSSAGLNEYTKVTEQDIQVCWNIKNDNQRIIRIFRFQEEFRRIYMQLEQLKEKNMRFGNRHLTAKISAMQEAAIRQDSKMEDEPSDKKKGKGLNNMFSAMADKLACSAITPAEESSSSGREYAMEPSDSSAAPVKSKRLNVTFSPMKVCECNANSPDPDSQSGADKTNNTKSPKSKLKDRSPAKSKSPPDRAANGCDKCSEIANGGDPKVPESMEPSESFESTTKNGSPNLDGGSPNNCNKSGRGIRSGHARTHAIVINLDDKSRFTEEVTV
jgi:G protein-coupled receptor 158